jgi:hypothetical protein
MFITEEHLKEIDEERNRKLADRKSLTDTNQEIISRNLHGKVIALAIVGGYLVLGELTGCFDHLRYGDERYWTKPRADCGGRLLPWVAQPAQRTH